MQINPVSMATPVYRTQPERVKSSYTQTKTDWVNISPEAMGLHRKLGNMSALIGIEKSMDGTGETVTWKEIRSYAEKYRSQADHILDNALKELGISTRHKLRIETGSDGKIKVSGDLNLFKRRKLEEALNAHPEFRGILNSATSYAAILDAGERYPDFSAAYEENPSAAMARYGKEIIPKAFVMDYHDGESWMSGHLLPFQADPPA